MAVRGLHAGLAVALGVALGAGSLVAAFRLQTPASEQADTGRQLGDVTFEPSSKDAPEARDGKVVLITQRRGSYTEANAAIALAIGLHCPEGRGHSVSGIEPKEGPPSDDWDKPSYPAGSRFSETIGCDGPLPNEFPVAADVPERTAEATVQRVLAERGAGASDQSLVMTVPYYEQQPKYHAFDRALGALLRGFASDHCRDGQVVVDAVVVGTYPPADPAKARSIRHSRMILGTALSCRVRDDAKA